MHRTSKADFLNDIIGYYYDYYYLLHQKVAT